MMSLALDENLTRALGAALRALDKRIAIVEKLEKQASEGGQNQSAKSWARRAREFADQAKVIRDSVKRADEIAARFAAE
jgi:two-component system chemotaxis response regulator CheB